MTATGASNGDIKKAVKSLERRARQILKARPAYTPMVDFYLTVFRRQIEWSNRLAVRPERIDRDQRSECLGAGQPLVERYDPGIDSQSLLSLWNEMKAVFRSGNDVLRAAVDKIEVAEKAGDFSAATWLLEQRPDRLELVSDASRDVGIDESVLATLARAVTFPHWKLVAQSWLGTQPSEPEAEARDELSEPEAEARGKRSEPEAQARGKKPDPGASATEQHVDEWQRFQCPVCGGPPGLVEIGSDAGRASLPASTGDGISRAMRRLMHCPFCGARWDVPALRCPACGSTRSGDAKYYFTPEEPELRIDFCNRCKHYLKVVNADKISGRLHIGLELLTTAHLDAIAQDKHLKPLIVGDRRRAGREGGLT